MLQHTFQALETNFQNQSDASVDAAKGVVECICRVIIDELDNPEVPRKPNEDAPITEWVSIATRLLVPHDKRDRHIANLIKHYNGLAETLREFRNEAGPLSHGKNGFMQILSVYHHRAAILSADAIVSFLHQAYLGVGLNLAITNEPYEHEHFNNLHKIIDLKVSLQTKIDDEGYLVVDVLLPLGDALPLRVAPSRLLYQLDRDAYVEALNAARSAPGVLESIDEQGEP